NIAGAVHIDANNSILRDLNPSSGNSKLNDLQQDFNDVLDEGQIKIYSFQEGTGRTGLNFAGGKVVPDESSSFNSQKFETLGSINADHVNMCRFRGRDDDGFEKFVGAMAALLKNIKQRSQTIEVKECYAQQAKENKCQEGS
ncbi:MAG: hypothetical protein M1835_001442, partial [Candelina submexicana]